MMLYYLRLESISARLARRNYASRLARDYLHCLVRQRRGDRCVSQLHAHSRQHLHICFLLRRHTARDAR